VLVLGAGFGGLELAATLSERMGDRLDLILMDKSESFYFGYSKLDVMFGRKKASAVKYPYSRINKSGVQFRQESIHSIDPVKRQVITQKGSYEADVMVIALGADYDMDATPGLAEGGYEFYTFEGAERVREVLPTFKQGHAMVGVCSFPFKCPPAPSETALLLHEYLVRQRVRDQCTISLVLPFELPLPPSYGTSKALLKAFKKNNIHYIPEMMVGSIDAQRKIAELDDGQEIPFDLFLGIPEHCVPAALDQSGLVYNEWIPVDPSTMLTKFPDVYAIGDVASAGIPKSGQFAAGAARSAAEHIIAKYEGHEFLAEYDGAGSCYVEFGEGRMGRADVEFFRKPYPKGIHRGVSKALAVEKNSNEERQKARWFA
jgi:sulfide:quinone oxidoreductase